MSLSRQQITLLGIFALFMGPVILVIMMRSSWWQYQPAGLKNRGHLIQPPLHLAIQQSPGLERKWIILYVPEQPCGQACIEQVTALRQIHKAAGRNQQHLAVALLVNSDEGSALRTRLEAIYPKFQYVTDPDTSISTRLDSIGVNPGSETGPANDFHTYVVDPLGNAILAYGTDARPNDIHQDLKRLLKWSDQENRR